MIKPLTSFRFIAAIAVFLSHIKVFYFYEGYLGVTFFFILSGFILTVNYSNSFNRLEKETMRKFYIARISRIYPVHLLTFFIAVPISLYKLFKGLDTVSGMSLKALLNLTLTQSFIPVQNIYFSYNDPSWSLSNEAFFYATFPFILWVLVKYFTKLNLNVMLLLSWLIPFGIVFTLNDSVNHHWAFYVFPAFRIFDFIIGIVLGLIFLKSKEQGVTSRIKKWSLLEVLSIVLLIGAIYLHGYISQPFRWGVYYQPFMALVIMVFAYQKGILSKILSNKILLYLGEISFSFYMIHKLIIHYVFFFTEGLIPIILSFVLSLITSALIYKYYEMPAKKMMNTYSNIGFVRNKETKVGV